GPYLLIGWISPKPNVGRRDLRRNRSEIPGDASILNQPVDLRQQPVLDARGIELRPTIAERNSCPRVVTTQRGFHGRVLSADHQDLLAKIGVRIAEIMAHMRQVFAGNVEPSRLVGPAGAQDDPPAAIAPPTAGRLSRDQKLP